MAAASSDATGGIDVEVEAEESTLRARSMTTSGTQTDGSAVVVLHRSPTPRSKLIFYKYARLQASTSWEASFYTRVLLRLETTTERTFSKEGPVNWGGMSESDLMALDVIRTAHALVRGVMFFSTGGSTTNEDLVALSDEYVRGGASQKFRPPEYGSCDGFAYTLGDTAVASACPRGGGHADNWSRCEFAGIYGAPSIQAVLKRAGCKTTSGIWVTTDGPTSSGRACEVQ